MIISFQKIHTFSSACPTEGNAGERRVGAAVRPTCCLQRPSDWKSMAGAPSAAHKATEAITSKTRRWRNSKETLEMKINTFVPSPFFWMNEIYLRTGGFPPACHLYDGGGADKPQGRGTSLPEMRVFRVCRGPCRPHGAYVEANNSAC